MIVRKEMNTSNGIDIFLNLLPSQYEWGLRRQNQQTLGATWEPPGTFSPQFHFLTFCVEKSGNWEVNKTSKAGDKNPGYPLKVCRRTWKFSEALLGTKGQFAKNWELHLEGARR